MRPLWAVTVTAGPGGGGGGDRGSGVRKRWPLDAAQRRSTVFYRSAGIFILIRTEIHERE